jgi:tetratricopeptide (TPR) repeat protein
MRLQEEIARAVTDEVQVKLTPEERTRLARSSRPVDPVAQDEYLRGLYFLNKMGGEPDWRMAITHFNKAIETDPTYAPAYAELAISYFWLGNPEVGGPSAKETMPQAKVAVTKALQLDPSLARAHLALGLITLNSEWNWAGAEDQYRTALKLNPNCGECLHQYSVLLTGLGRNDEAIAQIKHEIESEPLNVVPRYWLAQIAFMSRQYDSSIRELEVLCPNDMTIGLSYAQEKKYPEAIASLQNCRTESAPCGALNLALLAQVFGFAGQNRDAQKIIDELKERARHGKFSLREFYGTRLLVEPRSTTDQGLLASVLTPVLNRTRDSSKNQSEVRCSVRVVKPPHHRSL